MRVEKKEKVEEKKKVLEIQEEVRIANGEESLILEKGDRIQVMKDSAQNPFYRPPSNKKQDYRMKVSKEEKEFRKEMEELSSRLKYWISIGQSHDARQMVKDLTELRTNINFLPISLYFAKFI